MLLFSASVAKERKKLKNLFKAKGRKVPSGIVAYNKDSQIFKNYLKSRFEKEEQRQKEEEGELLQHFDQVVLKLKNVLEKETEREAETEYLRGEFVESDEEASGSVREVRQISNDFFRDVVEQPITFLPTPPPSRPRSRPRPRRPVKLRNVHAIDGILYRTPVVIIEDDGRDVDDEDLIAAGDSPQVAVENAFHFDEELVSPGTVYYKPVDPEVATPGPIYYKPLRESRSKSKPVRFPTE